MADETIDSRAVRRGGEGWKTWAFATLSTGELLVLRLLVVCLLLMTAGRFAWRNHGLIDQGGMAWSQGEWLINLAAGQTRRGPGGEVILWLHDLTGLSLLTLVEAFQTLPVWGIIAAVLALLARLRFPATLGTLSVSPTFILAWYLVYSTHGKDTFAYFSLAPIILAAISPAITRPALAASLLLFAYACAAYEPAVLLAPAMALAGWLIAREDRGAARAFGLGVALVAAFWAIYSVVFVTVTDAQPMCEAVSARGGETLCEKFVWNTVAVNQALGYTFGEALKRDATSLAIAASITIATMWMLVAPRRDGRDRNLLRLIALQALAFTPLFFVAIDYGRWLNMMVVSITLLLFIAAATGRLPGLFEPRRRIEIWPVVLLSLCWGITQVSVKIIPGVLPELFLGRYTGIL